MMTRRMFLNALALAAASQGLAHHLHGAAAARLPVEPEAPAVAPNLFGIDLYNHLATAQNNTNLFFSPYSIHTALSMTAAGARGQTLTQMADVLRLGRGEAEAHAVRGKLIEWINAAGGGEEPAVELSIANRLWGPEDYPYDRRFLNLVKQHYGVELKAVDFARSEEARRTINAWVEDQTRQKITDLLPPGSVNALTRLVLTNAIYFKGDWASPFDSKLTREAPFHLAGGTTADVPMMNRTGSYRHVQTPLAQVLELPYVDETLSMLVFLPKNAANLRELEKPQSLKDLLALRPRPTQVRLSLPKLRVEQSLSLPQPLKSMGMIDAFDDRKADLSGITTAQRGLYISAVVHKAYVDVNEEGTEAAAATGVAVGVRMAIEPVIFKADHPFLFIIRHNASGAVLFMGRVSDPRR